MLETIAVSATAEHIANGVRGNAECCALALAFIAALPPGCDGVDVDGECVEFADADGVKWAADLPEAARTFVEDFDAGEAVEPIAFTVTPKEEIFGGDEEGDEDYADIDDDDEDDYIDDDWMGGGDAPHPG